MVKGRGNDPTVEDHALDECKLGISALLTPIEKKEPEVVARPHVLERLHAKGKTHF